MTVSKSAKTVSKSAKSVTKAPPPRSEPQVDKDNQASCERYPSNKVGTQRKLFFIVLQIFLVLDQQEADLLRVKAQNAENRSLREKRLFKKPTG